MKKKAEKIKKKITGQRILRLSVNSFLYFVIGILVILLVAFGLTQTSIFRDWLKDTIVEELNASMNGNISIQDLEGTIFTSLVLKNTIIKQNGQTIISSEHIEVKTSPLKLLFKIIYLRKVELRNTNIYLIEDSTGTLNVATLFLPAAEEELDSTSGKFPFAFQVADLVLDNINFSLQNYSKIGSTASYESIEMSDLRIDELNLKLSAFVDVTRNNYQVNITEFSCFPNFKFFNLRTLEGEFFATQNGILINDLNISTEESELNINAGITDINLFGDFTNEELGNAPLRLEIKSDKFSFYDVSTFLPDLNLIKGKIAFGLNADGALNNLTVKDFFAEFNNTSLRLNGKLANILDIDQFSIDASLNGTVIDPDDPALLFAMSDMPSYKEFGVVKFDTLTFKGNLMNFQTNIRLNTENGATINGIAQLNFSGKIPQYDLDLKTKNLNIKPFTELSSNLNSSIKVKGSGFLLSEMNANINFLSERSSIGDSYLEELKLSSKAENGKIESTVQLSLDTSTTLSLLSNFDFSEPEDPSYSLEISAKSFNIGRIMSSDDLNSRFNFELQAEGKGFNPDSLDLFLVMNLYDSFIYDFSVDSTALIVDVRRNDNGRKIINVISDIADLTISGDYSVSTLSDVISAEVELFQKSILDKYSFLFPSGKAQDTILTVQSKKILELERISLDYLVDFKDLLTIRFDSSEVEIDGSINGRVFVEDDSISFTSTVDLDYFKYWNNVDLFFLTRTKLDLDIWNRINSGSIDDFSAFLFFRTNRLYAGSNFYDMGFKTRIGNDSISLSFNTALEEYLNIKLLGNLDVNEERKQLITLIDSLIIDYNNLEIKNIDQIVINYRDNDIEFNKFSMGMSEGILSLGGNISLDQYGSLDISADNIQWRPIGREVFGINDIDNFDSKFSLEGKLTGNIGDPILDIGVQLNDLIYQEKQLGALVSSFQYADNIINADISFIDSLRTIKSPKFKIFGSIPLRLSKPADDNMPEDSDEMNMNIISENFDLSSLGNVVPFINDLSGIFNTDIKIAGSFEDPSITGFLNFRNTVFTAETNNLRYNVEADLNFNKDKILIDKLQLGNVIGTKFGGTLNGHGEIILDKLKFVDAEIRLKGDLKILDKISRDVNPLVYGDLAIQADGDIVLKINENTSFIDIPINVTVADLNFQLIQSAYQNTSGFIYRFPEHFDSLNQQELGLDSLIRVAEQNRLQQSGEQPRQSFFDYKIRVNMKTEAKMVVLLSKELNQDLVAVMDGNFELSSKDGRTISTGQLNLLEGSKLSFIKTFEVTGNVRVEKLDNPLLNIVATYRDYYYPADTTGTADEVEVAVKIRFSGPLSDLAKNFIKDEENIAVYVGSENIESDVRDPTKSTSDAFLFMIAGKFTDGATTQEINAAANTAANLAGTVLGGVLNKYLGDYVRSVQLRQVGTETKFNLIGRAGKFRYEIGGSTDVFQDLSRANVKIELPVIQRLLLRLERKEATNETTLSDEMFNELGLKYRFEF